MSKFVAATALAALLTAPALAQSSPVGGGDEQFKKAFDQWERNDAKPNLQSSPSEEDQGVCAGHVGTFPKLTSFESASRSFIPGGQRSEFETREQYEARVSQANQGNERLLFISVGISPGARQHALKYDATRQAFDVEFHFFGFSPATYLSQIISGGGLEYAPYPERLSLSIYSDKNEIITGSYKAANAYGVSVTVLKITENLKTIVEPTAPSIFNSRGRYFFKSQKDYIGRIGKIPMDSVSAQQFKSIAQAAIVVNLFPPYVIKTKFRGHSPTITDRRDVSYESVALVGDMTCGLILNETGKVVAAFDTN